jgi:hypothetical protein
VRMKSLAQLTMQCFNLCLLSAILLGIIYLSFGASPLVFGNNHGFELHQIGMISRHPGRAAPGRRQQRHPLAPTVRRAGPQGGGADG